MKPAKLTPEAARVVYDALNVAAHWYEAQALMWEHAAMPTPTGRGYGEGVSRYFDAKAREARELAGKLVRA